MRPQCAPRQAPAPVGFGLLPYEIRKTGSIIGADVAMTPRCAGTSTSPTARYRRALLLIHYSEVLVPLPCRVRLFGGTLRAGC